MVRILLMVGVLLGLMSSSANADIIHLIGDSQMGGLSPHLRQSLRREGHRLHVAHYNGWTARRYLSSRRVSEDVQGADIVILCFGGNNREMNAARYAFPVRTLVARISRLGVRRIIWLGPAYSSDPAREERKARTEHIQAHLLPMLGVMYVATYRQTRWLRFLDDRTHFTREGYVRWSQDLIILFREILLQS